MRPLDPKLRVTVGATLAAAFVLHWLSFADSPGPTIDTRGWTLTEFVEHLDQHGVQLHVVPGTSRGNRCDDVFLTVDPGATWLTLQHKRRLVECIEEWEGSVRVWYALQDSEEFVDEWGPYGCRIGRFFLFGDEQVLRRIQEVCRCSSGR